MVEVNGKLVRACATLVAEPAWRSPRNRRARWPHSGRPSTGFSATTCSTAPSATTTTATARSTTPPSCWPLSIRKSRSSQSRTRWIRRIRFIVTIRTSAFFAVAAWRRAKTFRSTRRLSIRWEDPHPRVLWDGGATIGESSCVSCGHCVTVCPCNALMEKSMLGHAGFLTKLPKPRLDGMIDMVKGVEPDTGYGAILKVSEAEAAMRESRIRRTKTVCTYCGVGCSFDIWTKDRHILKVEPSEGAGQRHFDLHQRKIRVGFCEQRRPADQAAHSRGRQVSRSKLG